MDKSDRITRYLNWVLYLEKQSVPLATYKCPCCAHEVKTMTNEDGEKWDSFTSCPFCGGVYFKIVMGNNVTTQIIYQEKDNGIKTETH
ncbi:MULTISPECIES: hypothetical protein [unclassified Klebsiella]|uniref:hypothetical protein n=1 Tax=Enterobacteriaceae TaxID=543 RepID=UPI0015DCDA37|nr:MULTISPECIES: hypothetical protein [unclassified Klebsiella]HAT3952091.1 hypothetical protein [Kluyvera ascorbata]BBR57891.1 hypothetical protein WP4W18E05_12590 [Klebsiella sp. WP4-W18-ESBL-05]BBS92858.1 hypothetical protein WP7S18C02_34730 [Klebsiella sp. WP7-S18-CRE-02]BBS97887.1 hypothetical protein WP7S18C03_34800 [Klebsiella sp. WP7-S18-CRE-03]BBT02954.1 hypothetical protein WP7S18E04_35160 [Klebsiella sp. WP7-S18-ESBL-04]